MTLAASARYIPRGIAAIDPQALGVEHVACAAPDFETVTRVGPLAIVDIKGPLTHEPSGFDTYAAILSRFKKALVGSPYAVVTRIASPGGDVSGAFDCARDMRAAATAAGVKWIAHSDAQICSAAYVLASPADEIVCSDTATIGSIGVIVQPVDTSIAERAQGIRFEIISSGERKADGNPHVAMSDESRAAIQQTVNVMAGVFFSHVGQHRGDRGLDAVSAQALQAGVRIGNEAVTAKLADRVMGFSSLCDELCEAGGTIAATYSAASDAAPKEEQASMAFPEKKDDDEKPKEDAVRAALASASEDKDEAKAARAKKALAAYDSDEDDKKKEDDEKAEAAAEAAAKAAAAAATAAAASASAVTLAEVAAELAALKASAVAVERAALFASRPDLPKAVTEPLRDLPVAKAKAILDGIPKIVNPKAPQAVTPVVGDGGVVSAVAMPSELVQRLDAAFGSPHKTQPGVVFNALTGIQQFGVAVPVGSNAQ
jgi:ClpP class serine protease